MATETKQSSITVKPSEATVELIITIPKDLTFTVADVGEVDFNVASAHVDNLSRALVRGFYERFKDAAAVNRADVDGNIIPKSEHNRIKAERLNDLAIHFESGTAEWSRKREGGSRDNTGLVLAAIMRVKECDAERAEAIIELHANTVHKGDKKAAMRNLATGKRVAQAMADIRAERAGPSAISSDEALDAMPE